MASASIAGAREFVDGPDQASHSLSGQFRIRRQEDDVRHHPGGRRRRAIGVTRRRPYGSDVARCSGRVEALPAENRDQGVQIVARHRQEPVCVCEFASLPGCVTDGGNRREIASPARTRYASIASSGADGRRRICWKRVPWSERLPWVSGCLVGGKVWATVCTRASKSLPSSLHVRKSRPYTVGCVACTRKRTFRILPRYARRRCTGQDDCLLRSLVLQQHL